MTFKVSSNPNHAVDTAVFPSSLTRQHLRVSRGWRPAFYHIACIRGALKPKISGILGQLPLQEGQSQSDSLQTSPCNPLVPPVPMCSSMCCRLGYTTQLLVLCWGTEAS